jgi:hypothetical protein
MLLDRGGLRRGGLKFFFDLFANDGKFGRRIDPNAHNSLGHSDDRYGDIIADEDFLANFSREYKHRANPSQKLSVEESDSNTRIVPLQDQYEFLFKISRPFCKNNMLSRKEDMR